MTETGLDRHARPKTQLQNQNFSASTEMSCSCNLKAPSPLLGPERSDMLRCSVAVKMSHSF